MNEKTAKEIIKEVKNSYNLIANHFDLTRQVNWPEFSFFLKYIKEKDKLLDFGCGNGRFYEMVKDLNVDYYGADISEKLLEIAKQKVTNGYFFLIDESLVLPFRDSFFDVIVCIATFHHIPSRFFQEKLLKEFLRILKSEGYLILTVWDFYKGKNIKYLYLNFLNKLKSLCFLDKGGLSYKDIFIVWRNERKEEITKRYFYAFSTKEIKNLLTTTGYKVIDLKRVPHGKNKELYNIVTIAKK